MSAARPVRILYFAALREALGRDSEQVALPADVATVAALRGWLAARGGVWAERFAGGPALRCAVDQVMAVEDTAIDAATEIAFFPPVTGG